MLYEPQQALRKKKETTSAVAEANQLYSRDVAQQLTECQQEREHLRVQVATYRDALDRLGQSSRLNDDSTQKE